MCLSPPSGGTRDGCRCVLGADLGAHTCRHLPVQLTKRHGGVKQTASGSPTAVRSRSYGHAVGHSLGVVVGDAATLSAGAVAQPFSFLFPSR